MYACMYLNQLKPTQYIAFSIFIHLKYHDFNGNTDVTDETKKQICVGSYTDSRVSQPLRFHYYIICLIKLSCSMNNKKHIFFSCYSQQTAITAKSRGPFCSKPD